MKRFAQIGRSFGSRLLGVGLLTAALLTPLAAQAQFTGSLQTITIDNVTSNWSGGIYCVGSNSYGDVLVIQNSGVLTNVGTLSIGQLASDSNNVLIVDGNGSRVINAGYQYVGNAGKNNQMVITNGAKVVVGTAVPYTSTVGAGGVTGNVVVVTGPNSLWDVRILSVGAAGSANGNQVRISNGGTVIARETGYPSSIGTDGNSNTLVVSDSGSFLYAYYTLCVGRGSAGPQYSFGNLLSITNDGTVSLPGSGGLIIGTSSNAGNVVRIDGGNLWVTNSTGQQYIDVRSGGTLTINSGKVIADKLYLTNANASSLQFNGGSLAVSSTVASNGTSFVVGNGSAAAMLSLVGGTHSFSNGLVIAPNASLALGGTNAIRQVTINGNVTWQTGGALDLDFIGTTNDYAQVNGTVTVPTVGTLRLRALDASTRAPITVLQATQIIGETIGWPTSNANGVEYKLYVSGNQLVLRPPPYGTVITVR
jgi:T5SS/PEP-CTERM-associated repeat protein